jgi:8-amino-7-oxononanoate synthase
MTRDAKRNIVSMFLFVRGILIFVIRPPTVPDESSRLRVAIISTHTRADLDELLDILKSSQICVDKS